MEFIKSTYFKLLILLAVLITVNVYLVNYSITSEVNDYEVIEVSVLDSYKLVESARSEASPSLNPLSASHVSVKPLNYSADELLDNSETLYETIVATSDNDNIQFDKSAMLPLLIEGVNLSVDESEFQETAEPCVLYYTSNQYDEYPVACQVWQMLRSQGWSKEVCAGILGNMMTECGGFTLNLVYNAYDPNHRFYGLCQWSLYYVPTIDGLDVESQINYLFDSIETQMSYFGGSLSEFLSITDPTYAAIYFQNFYEIGDSTESRYRNALVAYEYFKEN